MPSRLPTTDDEVTSAPPGPVMKETHERDGPPRENVAGSALLLPFMRKWGAYGLAIAVTLSVFGLRFVSGSWIGDNPGLILFILPIILSANFGGMGAGLVATAIVAVGTDYFFIPPARSFAFAQSSDLGEWVVLVGAGALVSVLTGARRPLERNFSIARQNDLRASEWKIQGGFALALACLSVIGVVSYLSVGRLHQDAQTVDRAEEIISRLEAILRLTVDSETGQRGFVITGNERFLEPLRGASTGIAANLDRLHQLVSDPVQIQRLNDLSPVIAERLERSEDLVALRKSEGFAAAQRAVNTGQGKALEDRIRGMVDQMKVRERELWAARERQTEGAVAATRTVIIFGSVFAFGVVAVGLVLMRLDFTGRARAEIVLQRQAALMDLSHDAILTWDWNGPITTWNHSAEQLYASAIWKRSGGSATRCSRPPPPTAWMNSSASWEIMVRGGACSST